MSKLSDKQIKKIKERDKARKKELKERKQNFKSTMVQQRNPAGYQQLKDDIRSYKDNKYKPEKKKKKNKEDNWDGSFEPTEFKTKVPTWKPEYQDTSDIDKKYRIQGDVRLNDKIEKAAPKVPRLGQIRKGLKSKMDLKPKGVKRIKGMNRMMKQGKNKTAKLSRFKPDPIRPTSFKEARFGTGGDVTKNIYKKKAKRGKLGPTYGNKKAGKKLKGKDKKIFGKDPRSKLLNR